MSDQFRICLRGDLAQHLPEFLAQVGLQRRGRLDDDWDQELGTVRLRAREQGLVELTLWRYDDDEWLVNLTYQEDPLPPAEAEQLRRKVLDAAAAAGMTVTAQSGSGQVNTKALSVWRPDPGSTTGVAPDESLPRLSALDAARVADYLDAGAVTARTTARMPDPWSGDATAGVPMTQRTDGIWRWNDAVSYYVRHYHLNPGTQFLDYLRERDFASRFITAAQISAVADEVFGAPPRHRSACYVSTAASCYPAIPTAHSKGGCSAAMSTPRASS